MRASTVSAISAAALLAACTAAHPAPRASAAAPAEASWSSPFAYCRAIGTIDRPDARYTGSEPPPAVVAGLANALGAPPAAAARSALAHGTFWRCMGGSVYACTVGANLPCTEKAVTSRRPTATETDYCRQNPGAPFIPMYVTGHASVYEWACRGAAAVAGKTIAKVDARGYVAGIWYRIPPPR